MPARHLIPLVACLAAAAPLSACGGDDDAHDPFGPPATIGSASTGAAGTPGDARAAVVAARLRAAGRAKGCQGVRALLHPAYGEVTDSACSATKDLVAGLRAPKAAAYGSAVVVDFTVRGGVRRSAVFVTGKGGLKLAFVEDLPQATVGTGFAPDFDDAAEQVLELAATGDCRALASVAHRSIGPAIDEERACDALPDSPLVKALEAEPKLKPRRLGGNSFYAFYSVKPKEGPAFTLILAQQDPAEVAAREAAAAGATGASGPSGVTGSTGISGATGTTELDPALASAAATVPRFAFVDALPTS